ncbi:MAG: RHS repeat-associated core domain-containing protein, partial [Bacteroidota bacterium]
MARRNGLLSGNSFGLIDNLQYSYSGNELTSVLDNSPTNGPNDFQDNGATGTNEFSYDDNGNLATDANKGLFAEYNHLNLPTKVDLGGGNELLYLYDAAGNKLARRMKQNGTPVSVKHYIGEFVYEGTQLEYFGHAEGRVVPVSG